MARLVPSLAVAAVAAVGIGCIDRPSPTQATALSSPAIRFTITTAQRQSLAAAHTVDVNAGYLQRSGQYVSLTRQSIPTSAGITQQIVLTVDLTSCLADSTREGASSSCPLRVSVALRDTASIALDSTQLGPAAAAPGVTPNFSSVDLAVSRFAVKQWVGDEALRLGGAATPISITSATTGYASGAAATILYGASGDSTGAPVLDVFQNGAWQAIPSGASSTTGFRAMSAVSPNEVWIAGTSGLYLYNGTSISAVAAVRDTLLSVAAFNTGGTGRLIFAGTYGAIWRGDGTTWTKVPLGAPEYVADICITSATEAFAASSAATNATLAVRTAGTMWRFNGSVWSATPTPSSLAKDGVYCITQGEAFSNSDDLFMRWNGSGWSGFGPAPPGNRFFNRGVTSANEIYAYGDSSGLNRAFYALSGNSYREVGRSNFVQASGPFATGGKMWADPRGGSAYHVGSFGRTVQVTGSGFKVLSYVPALRDMFASSPTNAVAVGWNLFLARWNGVSWTVDPAPTNTPGVRILQGVWSDGPSNAWAVGGASTILHWNGSAWTVVSDALRPILPPGDSYDAVWGQGSTVFLAGVTNITRCTSVTSCALEPGTGTGELDGIWGSGLNNIIAVGVNGRIVRYDGSTWSAMSSPTTRQLVRVWGSSASDVWAVGDSVLIHYNGTSWTNIPMTGALTRLRSEAPSRLQGLFQLGLWGSGPRDVYVGGEGGRIARFDGTGWTLMSTGTERRIIAISGSAGFGALAITEAATARAGPIFLRGVGPGGGFGSAMTPPSTWP